MQSKKSFKKAISAFLVLFILLSCVSTLYTPKVNASGEVFIIDPGHGGADPGALGSNPYREEKVDALNLSLAVGAIVSQYTSVTYTRTTDTTLSLKERSTMANAGGHKYLISIHRNSFSDPTAKGLSIFYYNGLSASSPDAKFATDVYNEVISVAPFWSRGVKSENFHMVREPNMTSCLIETGFISNNNDNAIFDANFDAIALAIATGMLKQIGITPSDPIDPKLQGHDPIDLGNDFYAYVKQTSTGLYLTNHNNNVCVSAGIDNGTQKWRFVRQSNGSYSLSADGATYWMNVAGEKYENGTNIEASYGNGSNSQKFFVYYINGNFYFKALYNNKTVDVSASTKNVQLYGEEATASTRGFEIYKISFDYDPWADIIGDSFEGFIRHYASDYFLTEEDGNAKFAYRTYADNQKWIVTKNEFGGYVIKSKTSGKVLDVSSAKIESGTPVNLYEANGTKAQSFFFIHAWESTFHIKPSYTNTVLTVNTSDLGVYSNAYGAVSDQTFEFITEYHIDENVNLSYGDFLGESFKAQITLNENGTVLTASENTVFMAQNTNAANQIWSFDYDASKNAYKITSASGLVLDVVSAGYSNGTKLQLYASNDSYAQRFRIHDATYGYIISPAHTQKVLDVNSSDGTTVQLYGSSSSASRSFGIQIVETNGKKPVDLGETFTSTIINKNSGLFLTGNSEGALNCTANKELWKFTKQINGSYVIESVDFGKVIDIYEGRVASGTNVQLYEENGTLAQYFFIYESEGGYVFVTAESGKVLDMDANSKEVHIYHFGDSDVAIKAQTFVFDLGNDDKETLIIKSNSVLCKSEEYLYNLGFNVQAQALLSQFDNTGVKIFDFNGNEISSDGICGTGFTVVLIKNGIAVDSLKVVIKGDVDGNGKVDSTDYLRIKSLFLGTIDLESSFRLSADVDGSNIIDSTDYLRIKSYFLGTGTL